jgi:hypothetical protein
MFETSHALKEREIPLPGHFSLECEGRGEKGRMGWMGKGINSMDMLRYSMHLLILLLIWMSPILGLVCPKAWFGGNSVERVSIVFLLGRKNVLLGCKRGWINWPLHLRWLSNWVDNFVGL